MVWLFHRNKVYCVIASILLLFSACDENGKDTETDDGEVIVAECPGIPPSLLKAVDGFPISLSPEEETELTTTGELRLRLIYKPLSNINNWKMADTTNWGTTSTDYILGVSNGCGYFVALGKSGSGSRIIYSTDCNTWSIADTNPFGNYIPVKVCYGTYGGGRLVAVGSGGKIAYSTNAKDWTLATTPSFGSSYIYDVAYGNGVYVAVANDAKVGYSTDGNSWTQASSPGFSTTIFCITFDHVNGRFFAAGDNSRVAYSTDGSSWTHIGGYPAFPSSTLQFFGVGYGNDKCVVVHSSGTVYYSDSDFDPWNTGSDLGRVAWNLNFINGRFIIHGDDATSPYYERLWYSEDAITWTTVSLGASGTLFESSDIQDLQYFGGKLIAVGYNGKIGFCYF